MKKTYTNVIRVGLGALLCVGLAIPASAQRGGEHSEGNSGGGGGSTPPPQQSAPAQQPQRSNPQPSAQPQQRSNYNGGGNNGNTNQSFTPNNQQRNNSYNGGQQRNNSFGSATPNQPRGGEHQNSLQFQPNRGTNGGAPRRYYGLGQQGGYPGNLSNRYYGSPNRGGAYRSYPGLQFGRNYVAPRPRGFYYNNRGYYGTYYRPQLGVRLSVLPFGYYPFYFGADQYYYNDGLYYQQQDNEYTVVEPPVGAMINKLPAKAQAIAINGMQYYELNGVYYQPITKDDGTLVYQIAGKDGELTVDNNGNSQDDLPQVGDLVDSLPEGCKIIKLNGMKYYVSQEGYYFQDAVDTNGDKVFKIAGTPTDAPGN